MRPLTHAALLCLLTSTPALAQTQADPLPIAFGQTISTTLSSGTDTNWFSFNVASSVTIRLTTLHQSGDNFEPCMRLYAPSSTSASSISCTGAAGNFIHKHINALSGGVWTVRVYDYPLVSAGGDYMIKLQCWSGACEVPGQFNPVGTGCAGSVGTPTLNLTCSLLHRLLNLNI